MVIITCLYLALIYLLFFKFKVLPWNKVSQAICLVIGVIILSGFLVGLQSLTPSSTQAQVTGRLIEIAPSVSGRVKRVLIEPNITVEQGEILFEIDPTNYQTRVNDLESRLELANLRLVQYTELASVDAGTAFQVEQTQAEVEQLSAQLESARFDLANTMVRAPGEGLVPRLFLQPGMEVSPGRAVLTFVNTDTLAIAGIFQQKSLPAIKVGDVAKVNFPALPGRIFESRVVALPKAIGNGQVLASGQLPTLGGLVMSREWPVYIELPEDFPAELRNVGLAATVYIHTENAGVVGIVALVLQWNGTSMDAIL
jgi:multidrug resistance efflux pump